MKRLIYFMLFVLIGTQAQAHRCCKARGYILAKANKYAQQRLACCGGYQAVNKKIKQLACGRSRTVPQKALHQMINQHVASCKKARAQSSNNQPEVKKSEQKVEKNDPVTPVPAKTVDEPTKNNTVTPEPIKSTPVPSPTPTSGDNSQSNSNNSQNTPTQNNNQFSNDQLLRRLQQQMQQINEEEQESGWQSWVAPGLMGIGALLGLYLLVNWFKQR